MVFSFDRKRRRAMRRWKNWVLSVARAGLPTFVGPSRTINLWRGNLLPLECEALPKTLGLLRSPTGASSLATRVI
ncbi:hypothetical protein ACR52_09220 [Pseudomonas fildesensis]|uniref:Uncharacterized protein n=1 Tax=Pseudomonas fildesensis TaxID=1674920 RepID=A0A0J8G589_9PSED|nr:hypothetical protein ACR52_09220 [Pseudomonas fildesensis]